MKAVYFLCTNKAKDQVAPAALNACRRLLDLRETSLRCDGLPVLRHEDGAGNTYLFAPTAEVVSHDYQRYLPLMNEAFADCDLAGIVNWHEGGNAPDPILCVHTTGDVPSGIFGAADPVLTTAALLALEEASGAAGLAGWSAMPEATHFSGIQYGTDPSVITAYGVPVIDIEIGSSPASWSNPSALEALARGLVRVFTCVRSGASVLFVGGVHFEPSLRDAVVNGGGEFAFSHVLPNQWLTPEAYQGEAGLRNLRAAVGSIRGGVRAVVFHDGLKGAVKDAARTLAAELGLPALKHKKLREGAVVCGV